MQALNAVDCITPAFTRTQQMLLEPFKFGRTLKLALCSYLAYVGSVFIPFPLVVLFIPRSVYPADFHVGWVWAAAAVGMGLITVVFYCAVRMEFVEFEMVVTRSKIVAPMWRRYGAQTWPAMAVKAGFGTAVCLIVGALGWRQVKVLIATVGQQAPGAQPDAAMASAMIGSMFALYGLYFLLLITVKLFGTVWTDFVLPFYTLEESTVGAAWKMGWAVIRREPLHICGYLLLKLVLAMAGYLGAEVVFLIGLIPIGLVVALIAVLGRLALGAISGPAAHLLMGVGALLLAVAAWLAVTALLLGCIGVVFIFLDAYAVYFLGGRYAKLGNYLEPAGYQPFAPPPLPPSEDEGDGPDLPMDPALA